MPDDFGLDISDDLTARELRLVRVKESELETIITLIFLDIGMPDMDGYETCRRLRAEPVSRRPYIVALTGWGQTADRQRALDGGFDAHFTKPADPHSLEALLSDDSLFSKPASV
jgi:CheY-like chemotaxis protein